VFLAFTRTTCDVGLCRNCDQLKLHAYHYLATQAREKIIHRSPNLEVEYSEALQKSMPIFRGPDQYKPWVRSLYRYLHGCLSLSFQSKKFDTVTEIGGNDPRKSSRQIEKMVTDGLTSICARLKKAFNL